MVKSIRVYEENNRIIVVVDNPTEESKRLVKEMVGTLSVSGVKPVRTQDIPAPKIPDEAPVKNEVSEPEPADTFVSEVPVKPEVEDPKQEPSTELEVPVTDTTEGVPVVADEKEIELFIPKNGVESEKELEKEAEPDDKTTSEEELLTIFPYKGMTFKDAILKDGYPAVAALCLSYETLGQRTKDDIVGCLKQLLDNKKALVDIGSENVIYMYGILNKGIIDAAVKEAEVQNVEMLIKMLDKKERGALANQLIKATK